jgi:hypothetical protein
MIPYETRSTLFPLSNIPARFHRTTDSTPQAVLAANEVAVHRQPQACRRRGGGLISEGHFARNPPMSGQQFVTAGYFIRRTVVIRNNVGDNVGSTEATS